MLVYRGFLAVQDASRTYRAGPVLDLAAHSRSETSRLRTLALPHLEWFVEVGESANLMIRTGDTARSIASVDAKQALQAATVRDGAPCAPGDRRAGHARGA